MSHGAVVLINDNVNITNWINLLSQADGSLASTDN